MKRRVAITILCLLISILFGGCANMTPTQKGAVGGGAVGNGIRFYSIKNRFF